MRVKPWLILGLVIVLAEGGSVLAQPGGGFPGGGRGGKGGRGFGGGGPGGGQGFDPTQFFERLSGGKDVWSKSDIDPNNQRALGMFDRIAQTLNITSGQITREQFATGFEQMRQNFGGGRGNGGPGGPGGPGGGRGGQSFDEMAEAQFKQLDQNKDGFLNTDEMPGRLRAQLDRWDTNRDNLIDLQEFKAYLRDETRQGLNMPATYELANIPEEEDKRPVVYNAKNFPKELPAWFKQLDIDNDGQIGLYEWRRAGKSVEEFMAMDRNNDGFLTVEEVLYAQALAKKSNKSGDVQVVNFGPSNNGPTMDSGSPGGGPQQGFGPGNGFPGKFGSRGGNGQPGTQFAGGPVPGGGDQPQFSRRQGRGGPPGDNGNGNGGFRKKGGRGGNGGGGFGGQ